MKEHKKIIKLDKSLLLIILVLLLLTVIIWSVANCLKDTTATIVKLFVLFAFIPLNIISILLYLMHIVAFIPFKIKVNKHYKDLEDELSKDNVIFYKDYKEQNIYLTDKYIVSVPKYSNRICFGI